MPEYRQLQKSEYRKIIPVWTSSFADTAEEILEFFHDSNSILRVYGAVDNGNVVSMLCCIDVKMTDDQGEEYPASYVYAVCTLPSHRWKGYSRSLLEFAEANERVLGSEAMFLVPENSELFRFYSSAGYTTSFTNNIIELKAESGMVNYHTISPAEYLCLREMQLYSNFVSYDTTYLKLQESISNSRGAGIYRLETTDDIICCTAETEEKTLIIREMLPYNEKAAACLATALKCDCARIFIPGTDNPFGMAKMLTERTLPINAYLSFSCG